LYNKSAAMYDEIACMLLSQPSNTLQPLI